MVTCGGAGVPNQLFLGGGSGRKGSQVMINDNQLFRVTKKGLVPETPTW